MPHQNPWGELPWAPRCSRHPNGKQALANCTAWSRPEEVEGEPPPSSCSSALYPTSRISPFPGATKLSCFPAPQSTSNSSFSVIVENVNCYSSGVICRKFISISVGNSLIIFDDDSGNPVRVPGGEGKAPCPFEGHQRLGLNASARGLNREITVGTGEEVVGEVLE